MHMVIASEEISLRNTLKDILQREGNIIIGEANDGLSALKMVRSLQPDFVILDYKLSVMDGLALAQIIDDDKLAPVLVLVDFAHKDIVSKAREGRGFGYLLKPVNEMVLIPAVDFTNDHFRQIINLQKEITGLKESIESRKAVERAKGILMKERRISEEEAFKFLQKQSMNKRKSLKEIAEAIILAKELVE
jgi:two-component system, response regulator PdtaR